MGNRTLLSICILANLAFLQSCKPRLENISVVKDDAGASSIQNEADFRLFLSRAAFYTNPNVMPDAKSLIAAMQGTRRGVPGTNPRLLAGVDRYIRFLEDVSWYDTGPFSLAHTDESGKPLDNNRYLARIRPMLKIPESFNNAKILANIMADGSRDEAIKSELSAINTSEGRQGKEKVLFIRFAESALGSGDPFDGKDAADRSFFFIPARNAKELDFAIMFSGQDTASVIAIDHSGAQPQTYYYDHQLDQAGLIPLTSPKFGLACDLCHKSGGFFPIHPDMSKPHDPDSLTNIKVFNAFVRSTGAAHHSVYDQAERNFDPAFPALDGADLDKARIQELVDKKKFTVPTALQMEAFVEKIATTESCGECHSNDKTRAALRPPMISPFAMVRLGFMPPDNKFTSVEAEAYAQLLEADYKERIIDYFVNGPAPQE